MVVAFCCVTKKPNSQKNDVRCEYTRGAPKPLLLQILIDICSGGQVTSKKELVTVASHFAKKVP